MEVTIIFKIAAVGILVSILSQVLKHSGRDEQAFMVSLAGLLIVLFWIVPYIYELFQNIQKLFVLSAFRTNLCQSRCCIINYKLGVTNEGRSF